MIGAFQLFIIVLMLAINGVFAAYEMALASVSRLRLHELLGKKTSGADAAFFMKTNMEASLAVVQLGITLVGSIAAAVGGAGVADKVVPVLTNGWGFSLTAAHVVALIVLVIPLSVITIVFAELVPKTIALNDRERVCLQLSPLMRSLFIFLHPVVRSLEHVVKTIVTFLIKTPQAEEGSNPGLHEIKAAAALARTSRLIGAHQEKILISAAQLSTRPVRDISLPITEVSMINMSATLSQALIRAHMDMHTRFPVVEKDDNPQTVVGYINFKDIMSALKLNPSDPSVRGIVRPITHIDGDKSISSALEVMMHEKLHIVIITDKNGFITGLVTLEDIIEELVGEIEDEFDRLPAHTHPFAGGWIMGGGVPLSVVARYTGSAYTGSHEGRLSDWCEKHGLDMDKGGASVEADGLRVTARKFRRKKVSEATVVVPF